MAAAVARKPIDVVEDTKARGLKALEDHFPPGTSAWAFWTALVNKSLDEFLAGKSEVLGVTVRTNGKASAAH